MNTSSALPKISSPRLPPLPSPRSQVPESSSLSSRDNQSDNTSVSLLCWIDQPLAQRKLRHGALEGDVVKVKEALKEGAYIDHRDEHSYTPLMYACSRGRITVIRELLKCGADMDLPSADGGTCLHVAAKYGKPNAVDELLRRGADANEEDKFGRTAAEVARVVFEADTDKCPEGVHPTEAALNLAAWGLPYDPTKRPGYVFGDEDDEPDEDAIERERQRVIDAKAQATNRYAAKLTPHEQVVAVLEDWAKAAEEIAENEAAIAEALEMDAGDAEVIVKLRQKVVDLTVAVEAQAEEQEAWSTTEADARARAAMLAQEVKVAEQNLANLSVALEKDQVVAANANSAKKLAAFDLAKARLERVEKEIELAKREGRPEVKVELEAMLPSLKDAKRKAQARAKELIKVRTAQRNAEKATRGRRGTMAMTMASTMGTEPNSPGTPMSPPYDTTGGDTFAMSRQFSETMSSLDGGGGNASLDGSIASDSRATVADAKPEDDRAFEAPDRFDGAVSTRLTLNDDAWSALDALQAKIDRLRSQVRFLGERPHC